MSIYRMGLMSSHGSDMEECPCDHTLQGGGRFFRPPTGFFVPLHGRRVHVVASRVRVMDGIDSYV